ncbi:MAG: branched-chain amino acid transaminase [Nitrososphaerales archaeon]
MEFKEYDYVWFDGQIVKWNEANVPVMTHAIHYGTSVIEGIRAYTAKNNTYVFRLADHMKRLQKSAAVYSIGIKYSSNELVDATVELIRKNQIKSSCYIRPLVFVGFHGIDLAVTEKSPTHAAILAFTFDQYLNSKGIRVCISSWRRINDLSTPPLAKAGGNYLNSVLATQECKRNGYDEAIMLDKDGMVSEAPGENVFIVRDGKISTPPVSSSVLEGITRDTAITIAKDMGYELAERAIPRTELYISDEIFLTGTAAEVTPVISVDGRRIGDGSEGKITRSMREMYSKTVRAEVKQYMEWLTPVWEV